MKVQDLHLSEVIKFNGQFREKVGRQVKFDEPRAFGNDGEFSVLNVSACQNEQLERSRFFDKRAYLQLLLLVLFFLRRHRCSQLQFITYIINETQSIIMRTNNTT